MCIHCEISWLGSFERYSFGLGRLGRRGELGASGKREILGRLESIRELQVD